MNPKTSEDAIKRDCFLTRWPYPCYFLVPGVPHISQESLFSAFTCKEDLQHINEILNTNVEAKNSSQLNEILSKSVTRPVQAGCNKMVRLGTGTWHMHVAWDGHKYVCEDDFTDEEEECLVYTFGINWDISFEEAMASQGMVVRWL